MLRQTNSTRYDWPVDNGPATDIDRSVYIGVRRVTTRYAPKLSNSEVDLLRPYRPEKPVCNGLGSMLNRAWLKPVAVIHVNISMTTGAETRKILNRVIATLFYRNNVVGVQFAVQLTGTQAYGASTISLSGLLVQQEVHRAFSRPRKIKRIHLGAKKRWRSRILWFVMGSQLPAGHEPIYRGSGLAEHLRCPGESDVCRVSHIDMIPYETERNKHSFTAKGNRLKADALSLHRLKGDGFSRESRRL